MLQPASTGAAKPGVRSKKEEEFDTSPLLVANKLKHQRIIDEQKLKVCLYVYLNNCNFNNHHFHPIILFLDD